MRPIGVGKRKNSNGKNPRASLAALPPVCPAYRASKVRSPDSRQKILMQTRRQTNPKNGQTKNRQARQSPWGSVESPSAFAPAPNRGSYHHQAPSRGADPGRQ